MAALSSPGRRIDLTGLNACWLFARGSTLAGSYYLPDVYNISDGLVNKVMQWTMTAKCLNSRNDFTQHKTVSLVSADNNSCKCVTSQFSFKWNKKFIVSIE